MRRLCLAALALGVCIATRVRAEPAPAGTRSEAASRLERSRALAQKTRWGEAVAELESALDSAPDDARVLSELGWAAFQAGDHRRARVVLERAAKAAKDRRLVAASLYSLGRVEEAAGRRDLAARRYRASLALRKNDTVEARLIRLPDEKSEPLPLARSEDEPFCAEPQPLAEVCGCVLGRMPVDEEHPRRAACRLLDEPRLERFRFASVERGETRVLLLERRASGWSVRGVVDENPQILEKVEAATLGPAGRVLRVTIHWMNHHESLGSMNGYDYTLIDEVYCTGPEGVSASCVLRVPVSEVDDQYTFGENPSQEVQETTLRVDLGDDGVAQVVLVRGGADGVQELLGPHRLW